MLSDVKNLIDSAVSDSIYIGDMPATPDSVVCIYASGGYPRDLAGEMIREPTFQIRVRNASYPTGYAVCETIQETLHGVNANGSFLLIEQQGDILDLGRDESNRPEWAMNFRAYYR